MGYLILVKVFVKKMDLPTVERLCQLKKCSIPVTISYCEKEIKIIKIHNPGLSLEGVRRVHLHLLKFHSGCGSTYLESNYPSLKAPNQLL